MRGTTGAADSDNARAIISLRVDETHLLRCFVQTYKRLPKHGVSPDAMHGLAGKAGLGDLGV